MGIIKQFVKAFNKDGDCFKYICIEFPRSTIENFKAGIFDGPQIKTYLGFPNSMNEKESCAWSVFVEAVKNFWEIEKQSSTKRLWPSYSAVYKI